MQNIFNFLSKLCLTNFILTFQWFGNKWTTVWRMKLFIYEIPNASHLCTSIAWRKKMCSIFFISVRLWNSKDGDKQDFWPKINILKENLCTLRIREAPVRQNLGMILENRVVQKLKLEKNVFYKKWSPKLIFLNEFFFEIFFLIFDIKNWLWKYNFGIFCLTKDFAF